MADGTRSQEIKRLDDSIRQMNGRHEESMAALKDLVTTLNGRHEESMAGLKDLVTNLSLKYDQIAEKVNPNPVNPSFAGPSFNSVVNTNMQWQSRFTKMEFPKFYGEDLEGWVYKSEKFFEINGIEESQKIKLASIHLEEKALHWFRWFEKSHSLRTWKDFTWAITSRFGDNLYEDATGQLSKLRQISSVKNYQEKFEELANKITGLPESFFVSCFISGLREEIKAGVQMFQPRNISQAMGLARLQEETVESINKKAKVPPKNSAPFYSPNPNSKPLEPSLPIRKLTQKDVDEKRQKGLCFGCDEKYFRGHVCKKKQLFLLETEAEEGLWDDEDRNDGLPEGPNCVEEEPQISVHALSGSFSFRTMRLKGQIKKHPITILIDSGSTHNFLDPNVAKRTGLVVTVTTPLTVVVAEGTNSRARQLLKAFNGSCRIPNSRLTLGFYLLEAVTWSWGFNGFLPWDQSSGISRISK